jgi:glutathione S-transferase
MKLYVFKSLPPFLWGYTRDIRILWALEECGIQYETQGLDCGPNGLQDETSFEAVSPFKQIPVIDDDGYILTESGAILLYLAEKSGKLIPSDLKARAQVYRWLITSLNNIEPFALPIFFADLMGDSNPHTKAQRPWMSTSSPASSRSSIRC